MSLGFASQKSHTNVTRFLDPSHDVSCILHVVHCFYFHFFSTWFIYFHIWFHPPTQFVYDSFMINMLVLSYFFMFLFFSCFYFHVIFLMINLNSHDSLYIILLHSHVILLYNICFYSHDLLSIICFSRDFFLHNSFTCDHFVHDSFTFNIWVFPQVISFIFFSACLVVSHVTFLHLILLYSHLIWHVFTCEFSPPNDSFSRLIPSSYDSFIITFFHDLFIFTCELIFYMWFVISITC